MKPARAGRDRRRRQARTARARSHAGRPLPARGRAARCRRRARSARAAPSDGSLSSPNSFSMVSKEQRVAFVRNLDTFDVERDPRRFRCATLRTSAGSTNRNARIRVDEAADQPRDRRCGRSSAAAASPRGWAAVGARRSSVALSTSGRPGFGPGLVAAVEHARRRSRRRAAQRRSSGSAHVPSFAGHDDRHGAVERADPVGARRSASCQIEAGSTPGLRHRHRGGAHRRAAAHARCRSGTRDRSVRSKKLGASIAPSIQKETVLGLKPWKARGDRRRPRLKSVTQLVVAGKPSVKDSSAQPQRQS